MKWVYNGTTGDSVGSFGNELTGMPNLVATPLNFIINKEGGAVRLNWDTIAEAGVKYQIYRGTTPTAKTFLDSLTTNTYLDNSISSSIVYYYWVRTLSSNGAFSEFSEPLTISAVPYISQDSSRNAIILLKLNQISNTLVTKLNIYKGIATAPSLIYDSVTLSRSYTDSSNKIFNTILYYRLASKGGDLTESAFSNEVRTIAFTPSTLISPINLAVKLDTICKFIWSKIPNALSYKLQFSDDSLFVSNVIEQIVTDTTYSKVGLNENKNYYWRVQTQDTVHYSSWSNYKRFQTFVAPPLISNVKPGNKIDTISWSIKNSTNIKYIKIYRDTIENPVILLDSIGKDNRAYIDTSRLILNTKYYYRLVVGNTNNIESDFSNSLGATPFNTKPISVLLQSKKIPNIGEYNLIKTSFTSVGSKDLDGKIVDYKWYINDSLINKTDTVFSFYYPQGTPQVKLVLTDNDGDKDSSSTFVSITAFQKLFQGGILGGITALSANSIFTADTTFDPINGASISKLDRSGNTALQLIVGSKIFTTPSVSSDSSIFITSGSTLNGFNYSGVPLWSTIPLGGLTKVTPTIDSSLNRIYVGVSNKNFFAIDYKTGKVVWSYFCDAPINTSAVITGDRKLIFTSQSGTLYGFDISKSDVQTTPKWKMSFGDIVTKSPAVDASSNIYVGTDAGRLIKFQFNAAGTVTTIWDVSLGSSIQTSPVIDADSNIYVGTEKGDFYKIDRSNGSTLWSYNVGAAIHSTPNISEYGTIYVANMNGLVTAINTDKRVLWKYQDVAAISANSLYINNMLYFASEKGSFTGIYDNPNSVNINTTMAITSKAQQNNFGSLASTNNIRYTPLLDYYANNYHTSNIDIANSTPKIITRQPVWGTFQGDYRRTGSLSIVCPSAITISKDSTGSLISNTTNYIQWYKNDSVISNAGKPIFKPSAAGNYSVKSNQVGCNTVASNSYYYIVTDVINISNDEYVKVNPNPISNIVNFDFIIKGYQHLNLDIFSLSTGNKIASKQNIYTGEKVSVGSLSSGLYIFRLSSKDNKLNYQFKMVKL